MASRPQYGGVGVVPDLNIGQPGSGLYAASQAHFRVDVLHGAEEDHSVFQPIPEQAAVFEDVPGPEGRIIRWTGWLVVDTILHLYWLLDLCFQLKTGHARALGIVGAFDADNIQETTLKDCGGNTLSTRARLVDYSLDQRIKKLYGNPTFDYITALTVTFRTMPGCRRPCEP